MMFLDRRLQNERSLNSSDQNDFPTCEIYLDAIWGAFTCLYLVFDLPVCVIILYELLKAHRRGTPFTPNDFFMLNISVMDLLFLVVSIPGLPNIFTWQNMIIENIWTFTYSFHTSGRPLLVACICLDCYVAVVHPVIYHSRRSLTPRILVASAVWLVTVAIGLTYILKFDSFLSILSVVPFAAAVIIIGICDFFILKTLKGSDPGKPNIHPQKQRAVQVVISSLGVSVFSYLPPVLLITIGKPLISSAVFICTVGIPITLTASLGSVAMSLLHLKNMGKLDRFRFGFCQKGAEQR